MNKLRTNKWVILFILCLGGGIIYQLPYLRQVFYEPLVEAMGVTDSQFGLLASVYGITATICYFPGGWLADKFSARKLISFSFLSTGIGGFYFSTFPSYEMNILLNIFWGVTTTLTYWAAVIKAVGLLGSDEESGKMYGLLEGGRGLISTIAAFISLQIFNTIGGQAGVGSSIIFYSITCIVISILCFIILPEDMSGESTSANMKDLLAVSKQKNVWMISIIIFTTATIFSAQVYISPYVENVFGVSASLVVVLGIVRTYVTQLLGGPSAGFVSSKVGSSSKVLKFGYCILIISTLIYLVTPKNPALLILLVVNMIAMGFIVCGMRGIYFSTISEVGIDKSVRGSATGFVSCIGFLPDVIVPMIAGYLIQNFSEGYKGYTYLFMIMLVTLVIGFITVNMLIKEIDKEEVASK